MHQNPFGGQALPGPAGGANSAPPNPLATFGGKGGGNRNGGREGRREEEEGGRGKGEGREKGGRGKGGKYFGPWTLLIC